MATDAHARLRAGHGNKTRTIGIAEALTGWANFVLIASAGALRKARRQTSGDED
jgi:hypothetical protein